MEPWREELYNNELYHFGIKGMKWRKHKVAKKYSTSYARSQVHKARNFKEAIQFRNADALGKATQKKTSGQVSTQRAKSKFNELVDKKPYVNYRFPTAGVGPKRTSQGVDYTKSLSEEQAKKNKKLSIRAHRAASSIRAKAKNAYYDTSRKINKSSSSAKKKVETTKENLINKLKGRKKVKKKYSTIHGQVKAAKAFDYGRGYR